MENTLDKSCTYLFDKYTHKPHELVIFNWKWAEEGDFCKLAGNPLVLT